MLIVVTLLLPLLLGGAVLVDLVRRLATGKPMMASRLLLMGWVYLAAEVGVIAVAGLQWLASLPFGTRAASKRADWTYWLQARWVATIMAAMKGLFGLRFVIDGQELVGPGPVLVLFRHASIMETSFLMPSCRHRPGFGCGGY
jgi:hypothetical protein